MLYNERLGKQKRTRKLIENKTDRFMTGNIKNSDTKNLFDFYKKNIFLKEIKLVLII